VWLLLTFAQGLPDKIKTLQVRYLIPRPSVFFSFCPQKQLTLFLQAANDRLVFEKAELEREKQARAFACAASYSLFSSAIRQHVIPK
jgi:hypothetical protein